MPDQTLLQFFRARKDDPFFQFLTWYLILVMEWDLEDIKHVVIKGWKTGTGVLISSQSQERKCEFLLENGNKALLVIERNSSGAYFVRNSILVIQEV